MNLFQCSTRFSRITLLLALVAVCVSSLYAATGGKTSDEGSRLVLWYRQPAKQWTEALPVGNGRLAAMVFGGTDRERIQLNEETFWSGGPYDPSRPGGPKALPEIRRLIFAGEYMKAHILFSRTMMGMPVEQMKYEPLADLLLTFPKDTNVTEYRRELDLDKAIVTVSYKVGGVLYRREVFSSPVDQVIVVRLTADKPHSISFLANLHGVRNIQHSNYGTDYFEMDGVPPDGLAVHGRSTDYLGVRSQLKHVCRLKAVAEGGAVNVNETDLTVSNADAVTLFFAAATNFVNYHDVTADPEARVKAYLENVKGKSYEQIKKDHVAEHQRLFRRLSIDLGQTEAAQLPTDERIKNFAAESDPQLAALYYQFGRYIMISSSRPGDLPANLQGKWNEDSNPWWDSKYTTNINLQMNYWIAESANLAECVEPLITMMKEIAEGPGAEVARKHYGADGWVLHQNTDIWLASAPMDGPTWGTFSTGGAWLCTQLWDHYLYGGDQKYLKKIYPILKGSVEFFLSTLVKDPSHGWLVTCPSMSPENFPKREGNGRYFDEITGLYLPGTTICAGSTIDLEILRALFEEYASAAEILGVDKQLREKVLSTRAQLAPLQIGKDGHLQEWLQDWESMEPQHRHLSLLWGLFPGDDITPHSKPEIVQAARKSLIDRGNGGCGWSQAWKINLWARLLDGERAFDAFKYLVAGNTLPDLFCLCGRAMQVDGTFGAGAGIAEMLMQSYGGEISLLPALPKEWAEGHIRGMLARGGFELEFSWKDQKLTSVTVRSLLGKSCRIRSGDKVKEFPTQAMKTYTLNANLELQ
jgi:alpha-L-fucosidase 2